MNAGEVLASCAGSGGTKVDVHSSETSRAPDLVAMGIPDAVPLALISKAARVAAAPTELLYLRDAEVRSTQSCRQSSAVGSCWTRRRST